METGSLAQLLTENEVSAEVLPALLAPPYKINTVKQFANYFESKSEIYTLFLKNTKFKDEGDIIANLKQAWREADSVVARSLKRSADGLPDEALDDPLRKPVEEALKTSFNKEHKFTIPSTWLGTPALVGRIHRELSKRLSHSAVKLEKVRSVNQSMEVGPTVKRHRLSADVEVVTGEASQLERIRATFQYISKLQTLLYTMCYAGCWKATEDAVEVCWVPLQACLDHLANAQHFLYHNAGGFSESSLW